MATRLTTRSDWLAAHPPRLGSTLADVTRQLAAGEDFRFALREFLDEFALRGDDRARCEAIAERTYGDRLDPAARFFVEQVFSES